jgi:hypothetical protein
MANSKWQMANSVSRAQGVGFAQAGNIFVNSRKAQTGPDLRICHLPFAIGH